MRQSEPALRRITGQALRLGLATYAALTLSPEARWKTTTDELSFLFQFITVSPEIWSYLELSVSQEFLHGFHEGIEPIPGNHVSRAIDPLLSALSNGG